jgi:hypothetical protein
MKSQVKEFKNEIHRQFYTAYYKLPVDLYLTVREDLYKTCFWKPGTFYNRLNGSRAIKEIEIDRIEQVFRKYNIEVFKRIA